MGNNPFLKSQSTEKSILEKKGFSEGAAKTIVKETQEKKLQKMYGNPVIKPI